MGVCLIFIYIRRLLFYIKEGKPTCWLLLPEQSQGVDPGHGPGFGAGQSKGMHGGGGEIHF